MAAPVIEWENRMSNGISVEPFTIALDQDLLEDLRQRIITTRWPSQPPLPGWEYGADLEYLQDLLSTWADGFDWRAQERELNRFPHFRARIDGHWVHFVHVRGTGPNPMPIVLTHGWPSTFTEHLGLATMLADPAAHGGSVTDSFDVVVTSMPGYGFSDSLPPSANTASDIANMWYRLMRDGLGFRRFTAHGSDIGAAVTMELAWLHPDALAGIHMSAVGLTVPAEDPSADEREYGATFGRWWDSDGAYAHLQNTKPQKLACGLNDSPAGLAAWIIEKYRAWSDCGGKVESRFSRDYLLTQLTIYWATQTIGSSMLSYYSLRHFAEPTPPGARIGPPAGFAIFHNEFVDLGRPPRELAERIFNVVQWNEYPSGGHFPALEEPQLLAEDIRQFFRPLRERRS
jgi:pimeloyl-ACP methyl ester carboxylesterase